MEAVAELKKFNFWNRKVEHKTHYSAQSVLGMSGVQRENYHSTGCTSDQDGSQENGGTDCSTDPSGD